MSYGVQSDGTFSRKHVDTIRKDLKRVFKNELGEDVELRPSSPIQQIIDAAAIELARQWAAAEGAYYASFYQDAEGEALDKQLALAGFSRIPTRPATGEVTFSTTSANASDVTIPAGTVVTTERTETRPRIPFETTEGVTLTAGSTSVTAPVEALKPWQTDLDEKWLGEQTNVSSGTIVRIENTLSGVDSVNNPNPTGDTSLGYTEGRDRETDAEFKLRYENSLADGGSATVQAVKSGVYNAADDVASVKVEEVRDSTNSEYGVRVIVLAPGVGDDVIAQAILDERAGGLESFGASTGTGTLDDGTTKSESFERATEATILVDATLTTSSTYPSDGSTTISDKVIQYIGGTGSGGLDYPGLEIGEDVVVDQVFRRVMEVQGVVESTVLIGEDAPTTEQAADPDDSTVSTSTERGIRVQAASSIDDAYVEAQLSGNVASATRARLYDGAGNLLATTDVSGVAAGEWFRFDTALSFASGDYVDIGVDAEGASYTAGYDSAPAYPYDAAAGAFDIIERYRGDLSSDASPTATRPNVLAVRTNELAEANVAIGTREAAMTGSASISITEN